MLLSLVWQLTAGDVLGEFDEPSSEKPLFDSKFIRPFVNWVAVLPPFSMLTWPAFVNT